MQEARSKISRFFAVILALVMAFAFTPVMQVTAMSNVRSGVWFESAWVEWDGTSGRTYNVHWSRAGANSWTHVNNPRQTVSGLPSGVANASWTNDHSPLVRNIGGSRWRADIMGLVGGRAVDIRIQEMNGSSVARTQYIRNLTPPAFDRQGFAFSETSPFRRTTGGHNADGSVSNNAVVIYITPQNVNTFANPFNNTRGGSGLFMESRMPNRFGVNNNSAASLQDATPLIIRIVGNPNLNAFRRNAGLIDVRRTANVTIEGVGNNAELNVGLGISLSSNVIVRNIHFRNWGTGDGIEVQGANGAIVDIRAGGNNAPNSRLSTNNWVTHNRFTNTNADGHVDMNNTTYFTQSYNIFTRNGRGGLSGSGTGSAAARGTYHHNHYIDTNSRAPRLRWGEFHVFNNFFDYGSHSTNAYSIGAGHRSSVIAEGNYFRNANAPMIISGQGQNNAGSNTLTGDEHGFILTNLTTQANHPTSTHRQQEARLWTMAATLQPNVFNNVRHFDVRADQGLPRTDNNRPPFRNFGWTQHAGPRAWPMPVSVQTAAQARTRVLDVAGPMRTASGVPAPPSGNATPAPPTNTPAPPANTPAPTAPPATPGGRVAFGTAAWRFTGNDLGTSSAATTTQLNGMLPVGVTLGGGNWRWRSGSNEGLDPNGTGRTMTFSQDLIRSTNTLRFHVGGVHASNVVNQSRLAAFWSGSGLASNQIRVTGWNAGPAGRGVIEIDVSSRTTALTLNWPWGASNGATAPGRVNVFSISRVATPAATPAPTPAPTPVPTPAPTAPPATGARMAFGTAAWRFTGNDLGTSSAATTTQLNNMLPVGVTLGGGNWRWRSGSNEGLDPNGTGRTMTFNQDLIRSTNTIRLHVGGVHASNVITQARLASHWSGSGLASSQIRVVSWTAGPAGRGVIEIDVSNRTTALTLNWPWGGSNGATAPGRLNLFSISRVATPAGGGTGARLPLGTAAWTFTGSGLGTANATTTTTLNNQLPTGISLGGNWRWRTGNDGLDPNGTGRTMTFNQDFIRSTNTIRLHVGGVNGSNVVTAARLASHWGLPASSIRLVGWSAGTSSRGVVEIDVASRTTALTLNWPWGGNNGADAPGRLNLFSISRN